MDYPSYALSTNDIFYSLRVNPKNPSNPNEYDSPPNSLKMRGRGRLDSKNTPIMYASMDLEVCIHECRSTIEDELYFATLLPKKGLKLLDLTDIINCTPQPFESLDIALTILFQAGRHSYRISRDIATAAMQHGFAGLIYPSYYSIILRTGKSPLETAYGLPIRAFPHLKEYSKSKIIPNIALFGRPIEQGLVEVNCINRLVIKKVQYDIQYGPA